MEELTTLLFTDAGDMDKTIEYYEKHFGLKKVRYRDIPEASAPCPSRASSSTHAYPCIA